MFLVLLHILFTVYLLCHLSHLKKIYEVYFQVICLQKAAEIEYFWGYICDY